MEDALKAEANLLRTWTDEERGYCSEPDDPATDTTATNVSAQAKEDASNTRESGDGSKVVDGDSIAGSGSAARRPTLQRAMSQRMEDVMKEPASLVRTRTDEERGYSSEPEDLLADWILL